MVQNQEKVSFNLYVMKSKFLLFLSLSLVSFSSYSFDYKTHFLPNLEAKETLAPKKFDPEKLTYGGNFGATFGTLTYVDISPFIGYRLTDDWLAGVGVSYIYYRQRISSNYTYQTHLYGGRLFSQYSILDNVFVHGELEALNFEYYDFLSGRDGRAWYVTPLIGGGYSQPIGANASLRIMALYALNSQNPKSPYYGNPLVFRIGIFL